MVRARVPVGALPLGEVGRWRPLTEAEERESERTVPDVFAERAAATPTATAIVESGVEISYAELDRRSNQVAAGVLAERESSGAVGVIVGGSVEFMVSVLGVLKAGRIVLPLDPRAPVAALVETLAAAHASLVLGEPPPGSPFPLEVRSIREYAREGEAPLEVTIEPGSGALLAFTSGSTGPPRGHLRSHRMMLHHAIHDAESMGIVEGTRVGLLLSPVFSKTQPLRVLLVGGTLLRYDAPANVAGMARWLTEHRIEAASVIPSMIDPLLASSAPTGLPTLRTVGVGGEKVGRGRAEALRRLLPEGAILTHGYGSTEGSRICFEPFEGPITVDDTPLPVGFALPGYSVYLRDEQDAPAERGEIVVESRYLSLPWDPENTVLEGARPLVLRSGDLGSVDADGRLSVLGRLDRMVKIRGYRIELDAIERALIGLERVRTAAVVDESSPRGTRRLVAYVAFGEPPASDSAAELRRELERVLPPYMIPTRFVVAESLPLMWNGKVDLRALAGSVPAGSADPVSPPVGAVEKLLASIWAEVLDVERVGREDDFLELGGDSLSAAVIASAVLGAFGVELTSSQLDENQTIAAMAATIERLQTDPPRRRRRPIRPAPRRAPLPATLVQEAYWRDGLNPGYAGEYTTGSAVELRGKLDAAALERAIAEVVRRHEVLRTTFLTRRGRPVQVVHAPPFLDFETADLRGEPDPTAAATALIARERARPFDLARGPLARFRLVRTGEERYELLRVVHHLVTDGWSTGILFQELAALYTAYRDGEASPLPELELQYGDYAVWERKHLRRRSRYFWEELAWWRRNLTPRPAPLRLPFERAVPDETVPPAEGMFTWTLSPSLSAALDAIERACSASYFSVRMALVSACLLESARGRDVVVGANIGARRLPELQPLIGLFANMTPVRLRLEGDPSFRDWVSQVRRAVAVASEHAAIPYGAFPWAFRGVPVGVPSLDAIVGGERTPAPWESSPLPGLELREPDHSMPPLASMPRKLDLRFSGGAEGAQCRVRFDARRYDPVAVEAFLDELGRQAEAFCRDPDLPITGSRELE